VIVADLYFPDGSDLETTVYLSADPFPGDQIKTADGTLIRVIRRTFYDLGSEVTEPVGSTMNLEVRIAN
jgi:hypothetical protein